MPMHHLVGTKLSESIVVEALSRIPPFPPIAAKVLALLSMNSVEISEVSELIGSDPTFSGRLLRCVNSYEFGLRHAIIEVQQAIVLLGLERTRREIVTAATAAYAGKALKAGDLRRCWEHTVATAILAEEIARACQAFTGVAYTAGIMHDIGRLGLLVAYPREYESIIHDAAEQCLDLLDFERERFGMHHTEAGRMLIEHWHLPDEFLVIAGRHHDPCEGEEVDLLRIVHVACRLADSLGYGVSKPLVPLTPDAVLAGLPPRVRERFHMAPDEMRAQIDQRLRSYDSDNGDTPPDVATPEPISASVLEVPLEPIPTEPDLPPVPRRLWPAVLATSAIGALAMFFFWLKY